MDLDILVDEVTREIMRRLNAQDSGGVLLLDGCPGGLLAAGVAQKSGTDLCGCGYVLMTAEQYCALTGGAGAPCVAAPAVEKPCCDGVVVDLTAKRLLHERDLRDHNAQSGTVVKISKKTIITALAHDYAKSVGIKIVKDN